MRVGCIRYVSHTITVKGTVEMNFLNDALEAGFTQAQAEFLNDRVAPYPHSHEISEVEGLDEVLEEMEEEEEEEE